MSHFILEQLSFDDISQVVQLSELMGWDYTEKELYTVLKSGKAFGHKTNEGRLISSAAIFQYGQQLASIGLVMVDPDFRRLGLGKSVTQKCIDVVSEFKTPIMLIATPKGKVLYEQIGFRSVSTVHKYICERYDPRFLHVSQATLFDNYSIRPLSEMDLSHILKIDVGAVGAERNQFLKARIQQAKEAIVLTNSDGMPVGYGLSIQNPNLLVLGPIVAPNDELAATIVDQLAKNHEGRLRIDIPSAHEQFRQNLELFGFKNVSQPPIMLIHAEELPSRNNTLYAIAAQAFG